MRQADVTSGELYLFLKSRAAYLCPSGFGLSSVPVGPTPRRTDHSYAMNCLNCHVHDTTKAFTPASSLYMIEASNLVSTPPIGALSAQLRWAA
jgi:hypothetical protein